MTVARKKRKDSKIDTARALQLANKGVPQQTIADTFGVTRQAVCKALKPFQINLPTEDDQERIRRQITPLMEYNLHKTVAQMVNTDDPKAFKDWSISMGILNQNFRLNTGQSTQSVAVIMAKMALEADEMDSKTVDNS